MTQKFVFFVVAAFSTGVSPFGAAFAESTGQDAATERGATERAATEEAAAAVSVSATSNSATSSASASVSTTASSSTSNISVSVGQVDVATDSTAASAPDGAAEAVEGEDGVVSRTFDLRDFDMVRAAGVYSLRVEVGPDYAITVSGPAREMAFVDVSKQGGALILDQAEGANEIQNREAVDAVVTLPALKGIAVAGVVNADIAGVNADAFSARLSGVGDVTVSGTCAGLDASISGVGDFNGRDLACQSADVNVSGVGDATVFADDSVDIAVSGMGNVNVYGSPENVSKTGGLFSKIRIK